MTKTCKRCGATLPHPGGKGCPDRPSRRSRPSRGRNRGQRKQDRISTLPIRGMDSEAQGDRLVYVSGVTEYGDCAYIMDPDGLDSDRILGFLTTLPRGLKVAFAWNYDATMILRDWPFAALDRLRRTNVARYDRWTVRHIPGKRFWIRNNVTDRTCQIWDVWSWWARSFAHLLDTWDGLLEPDQVEFVRTMKGLRDQFDTLDLETIARYCDVECQTLARWTRDLLDLHERVGLRLRSYCGPGSTASAIYSRQGWRPPERDESIRSVAQAAYFGGRNEVSAMGHIEGPIYCYDIGSAYPAEIADLPELGTWTVRDGLPKGPWWGFADVSWSIDGACVWGPFPVRGGHTTTGRTLSLVYPSEGRGVYHSSEIEAAFAAYGRRSFKVHRAWINRTYPTKPFAWVRELAATRLKLKAEGDPAAYPLKVGLNSLYGKMAQRSGTAPYRDVVYAAAVTAATRARLLRLLVPLGRAGILAATDGILSTERIEGLELGPNLGQWEEDIYPSATLIQSGVYWLGDKIRTRGFRKRSLDRETLRLAWTFGVPEVIYQERRFVGYRLATARGNPEQVGVWTDGQRRLRLDPYPRRVPAYREGDILYTTPCSLEAWALHAMIDTAFDPSRDPEARSLSEIEDPDWHLGL